MKTIEELRAKIKTVTDMQSVVSTMKSLAAARIRQYESAADATQAYWKTVQLAFQVLLRNRGVVHGRQDPTEQPERLGLILFGSDQGFCGRFNETVASSARRFLEASSTSADQATPSLLVVGTRLNHLIAAAGYQVHRAFRLPNSVAKITELTRQIIVEVEEWRKRLGVGRIELFHNLRKSASSYQVHQFQLLPISTDYLEQLGKKPWGTRSLPTYPLEWQQAFSTVVGQHLFVLIFRACAESLASENASRIAAMQQAEANIDERLRQLNMEFNQSRQRAITEELLDIISGFEAAME